MARQSKLGRLNRWLARVNNIRRFIVNFTTWHTGLQPSVSVIKFQSHTRKKLVRNVVRKLAKFVTWHTGLQNVGPQIYKLKTRKQISRIKRGIRKIARFTVWHTGLSPLVTANINVIKLRTRKRPKQIRSKFKKRFTYRTFNTGIQQSIPQLFKHQTRRRKKLVVSQRKRTAIFRINYHTGLAPIVSTSRNWLPVGLGANTRRGGY